jgi:hypothetical protein
MQSISTFSSIQVLHLSAGFEASTGKERLIRIVREIEMNGVFEVKRVESVSSIQEIQGAANIELVIPISVALYNELNGDDGLRVARERFNVSASSVIG